MIWFIDVKDKPKQKDSIEVDRNKQLMQSIIKPSQSNKTVQGIYQDATYIYWYIMIIYTL